MYIQQNKIRTKVFVEELIAHGKNSHINIVIFIIMFIKTWNEEVKEPDWSDTPLQSLFRVQRSQSFF